MMETGDTSVKVGIRIRPLSDNEVTDGCSTCLSYPNEEGRIIIGNDKLFGFDFIFKETDSQEFVYKKAALPMVDTVLKGYNATLFAYGQTGSGKTYTMGTYVTENLPEDSVGIVPRIIGDLFERMSDYEYEYAVKVSFLEIYKEDIHDLLAEDASAPLQIREENQLVKIPGLTETSVTSPKEVLSLLESGSAKRSVGSTSMNMKSSRSHAILTLSFLMRPKTTESSVENAGDTLTAKLHLVDLAGSERIKKTHAEGDRLKEGIDINRGLLALGNVISALCERDAKKRLHIPYRDSRLTRLLQDSLGGNSATLMLACVSPADMNMEETLNTLRYADRARLIKNKPILNRADPKDAELAKLRTLVAQLQTRLANGGSSFPPLSPCPKSIQAYTSNSNCTGSHFSSEIITNLMDKTKRLEGEKLLLCEELDRVVGKMNELYKKTFDYDNLWDGLFGECQKIECVIGSLKYLIEKKLDGNTEMMCCIGDLEDILTEIKRLCPSEGNEIPNEDIEHAYKQSSDFLAEVNSLHTCLGMEDSEFVKTTLERNNEEDIIKSNGNKENVKGSDIGKLQVVDGWVCKLRVRRLECKERIETIEASIREKNDLLRSLETAGEQGEESYCLLLRKYECEMRELESRIRDLELEKRRLVSEQKNEDLKESKIERERVLKAMEQELMQARRQLSELSRLKKAKEAREAECLRLRGEIQSLKASMIRSARQLKEESAVYRKWRKEKENEVKRLEENDRRLQYEMSRMMSMHEREQAVLRRRVEAAAAAERRLKELLLRQKDSKQERDKRVSQSNNTKGKVDLASHVRNWVKMDLDMQVSMGAARYHLSNLIESRKTLCDQVRVIESKIEDCREQGEAYEVYIDEVRSLTETIQSQTQQIGDLQQKLMDAGERCSTDGSCAADVSGQMLSSHLSQLHSIQEARIALKYLFKQATLSKVSNINLEAQLQDLDTQLIAQRQELENLRRNYSVEFSKCEENLCDVKSELEAKSECIERLQGENNSLQAALQLVLASSVNSFTKLDPTLQASVRCNNVKGEDCCVKDIECYSRLTSEYIERLQKENAELREVIKVERENALVMKSPVSDPSTELLQGRLSGTPVVRQNDGTFVLSSENDDKDVKCIRLSDSRCSSLVNKRLHADSEVIDIDVHVRDVKVQKKSVSEWSLQFTNDDGNLATDDDTHRSRCKCRGACQARCSCRRSGRPCTPSYCQCIMGKCQNRISDHSCDENEVARKISENGTEIMRPPCDVPVILRAKRKARALQLNMKNEKKRPVHALNETFDMTRNSSQGVHQSEINNVGNGDDAFLSPTDSQKTFILGDGDDDEGGGGVGGKGLVRNFRPRDRLSYFPSPLLHPAL
ncbi:unnamed protein product [Heterobilharzia americana]|nr:unnamed protein product [Heterobilharzia americana]